MPQIVVDEKGRTVSVILNIKEYKRLLRDSEKLESIKAYDEAKKSGGKVIPFEYAIQKI
jgi:ligand-binding sensor protein